MYSHMQAFRKAIGVRITEDTEVLEGEVNVSPSTSCSIKGMHSSKPFLQAELQGYDRM